MKTILLVDNVRGLYRGISSPMMGIGLVNAIVFGVYGNVQKLSENPNSLMTHFNAGVMAGIAQSFICAPMELAKTRLQLSKYIDNQPKFKGPIDCLLYVQKTEGIRGTFKGLWATILRDIPGKMQNKFFNKRLASMIFFRLCQLLCFIRIFNATQGETKCTVCASSRRLCWHGIMVSLLSH